MVTSSPTPRRISTPRWLDLRLVLGVVLVIVAVLLGATLLSRANDTHPVVTVDHDLAAGTVLSADDLTISQVRLPSDSSKAYVDDADAAIGKKLARAVSAGEILPRAALARAGATTTVTIPLSSNSAPDLRVGERIELWLSTERCASVVLLDDVTVQDVHSDNASFDNGANGQDVVISVRPDLAARVVAAQAISDAQIRAGVLNGGARSTTVPPIAATGRNGLPADLAACVPTSR